MPATSSPKFTVVVHEPTEVPAKIVRANSISLALSSNSFYPVPSPALAVFNTNIENVANAQAGCKTTPPTSTIAERDGFVAVMDGNIETYRLAGQGLVNAAANESEAEQIAQSFDMELKTHTATGPRQDAILDGPLPGTAIYRMKGAGPHQVQMSMDGGTTSTNLDPTGTGKAVIPGLTIGVKIWLRNRQVLTHSAYGVWGDWNPFMPTM